MQKQGWVFGCHSLSVNRFPVRLPPAQDDLFQRTLEPVKTALKDSGLAKSAVNTVILAGSGGYFRAVSENA